MQPMLGLSRCLLVQDEIDLTETLFQGWKKLSEGGLEKTSEALQIFRKAIELDPKDPRAHNYCGIANEILGEESDSKKTMQTQTVIVVKNTQAMTITRARGLCKICASGSRLSSAIVETQKGNLRPKALIF